MADSNVQGNGAAGTSLEEIARQRDEARQQAESDAAQTLLQEMKEKETPSEVSDAEKRRVHEESEAQRRAQWESEKKKRDDEVQFAWEEAVCVSDDELQKNSVKRLGDMTERLTRRNMKICVTESIQTLCYEDLSFARLVMHPRKSMINCFKIFREVYLLAGAYPYEGLYTLQHFMNNTFLSLSYQKLSAAAVILALVMILLIALLFKVEDIFGKDVEG